MEIFVYIGHAGIRSIAVTDIIIRTQWHTVSFSKIRYD